MPYRALGITGENVSAIGLGGWHIGLKRVSEKLAIRIIRAAIDRGINFLDNSWDYNAGVSEIRMGKALAGGYRNRVFLMTRLMDAPVPQPRSRSMNRCSACRPIAST